MINADLFRRARIMPAITRARGRLPAVAVGAALFAVAGLSGPAVASVNTSTAATAYDSAVAVTDQAVQVPAHPTTGVRLAGRGTAAPHRSTTAAKVTAPNAQQMHPRGIHCAQEKFVPTADQLRNAQAIIGAGKKMGLPPRAWVIAVATALQESTLNNFGHLGASNDHDSLGLFQQRPSAGWGSPRQLQNPDYASKQFYRALVHVPGWNKLPLTVAAQSVQVSAFPDHYAKWEAEAGHLVSAFHGAGPYAKLTAGLR